ncbi:MAG: hypothetical protein ACYS6W_01765 [Planctomycetota bacterium]|jgi:predicted RND superfamily exporter protein
MSKIDENEIRRRLKLLSQIKPTPEATRRATERVRDTLVNKEQRRESTRIWRAIIKRPITKLAAAAVLLIAAGYTAGRLSAPPADMKQLRSDLETSLKLSLEEEMNRRWQPVFTASCVQLKEELHQQLRRDLAEFADRILTASGSLTEQRLMELINLIEDARKQDRRRVATALEQIEINRLQDLVTLAAQTNELLGTKNN